MFTFLKSWSKFLSWCMLNCYMVTAMISSTSDTLDLWIYIQDSGKKLKIHSIIFYILLSVSYKKEDVVWLPMRQLSLQETKMTQKLTFIGNRTAFNNEQSPYRIASYERPEMTMWNNSNEKIHCLIYIKKKC